MPDISGAQSVLASMDREELGELAATSIIGHSAVCRVASASEESRLSGRDPLVALTATTAEVVACGRQ